ncbi:MAG: hypothetical protein LUD72_01955 [Bacteroidales bacterium]|nr:hypothetical protein [Bacteroidales bacterium]
MGEYIERPEFEQYTQKMDAENHRQNERLRDMDTKIEKIGDLTLAINNLTNQTNQMVAELKSMSGRLKTIEDEPKETIKTVRAAVLSAIGGAIAAAIVAAILTFI